MCRAQSGPVAWVKSPNNGAVWPTHTFYYSGSKSLCMHNICSILITYSITRIFGTYISMSEMKVKVLDVKVKVLYVKVKVLDV